MFTRPKHRRLWLLVAGAIALLAVVTGPGRRDVAGQSSTTKLTTTLADLAASVSQIAGGALPQSIRPFAFEAAPVAVQDAMRSRRLRVNDQGEIQVYVLMTDVSDTSVAALTAAGATVEIADPARLRVQARVAAARLQAIAALPFVTFVRLPTYAHPRVGAATTEGDAILGADVARQQFGLDGAGIKVGVISDGLKGVFATGCTTCAGASSGPIATGDLPSATGVRSIGVLTSSTGGIVGQSFQANRDLEGKPPASPPCAFGGAGAEGTALLEIVHDLAPAAQLAFANAGTTLEFNQAVNALAAANDVVVDDLGFFGEPYDGTSSVSQNTATALNGAANRIRAYVTANGNDADEHYFGRFVDSGVDGTTITGISTPGRLHLFQRSADTTDALGLGDQPYNLISLPNNGEVVIFLSWDEAQGRAGSNYDLYLVRQSTNAVVARSTDAQTGSQDPLEVIDFTNTGASDFFRIVVQNVRNQAQPQLLNLFSFQPECAADGPRLLAPGQHERHNFNTASRSMSNQSDAGGSPVSVISVGAICSGSAGAINAFAGSVSPDESCLDRNHATAEFFSSQGPTLDGRTKPDVAAIDGVAVTGAGGFPSPFFGTSAAAPHVAAEAALLLQAAPCLASGGTDPATARASLRNLILSGAQPMSDVPPDNLFGAGLANVLASVQRTLPVYGGGPVVTIPGTSAAGATISPAALGFTDPDQCPITRLSWSGGCGSSPGSSLTCPFGATNLAVSASNNGLAFSQPSSVQVVVSGFSIAAAPGTTTVAAGQAATFHITTAAVGGPFQNAVSLSCADLPQGARCSFSPPTVAPGAGAVDAVLTVTTTSRSTLPFGPAGRFGDGPGRLVLVVVAVAWLCWLARRRALVPATVLIGIAAACGGGSMPAQVPPPTATTSVQVSPASVTFGSQTVQAASAPQVVTVTNTGTQTLTISSISASGDFVESNGCGNSVAPASSCAVAIVFTPSGAGARTGVLTIADSATGSPHTVSLAGAGVSPTGGTPAGTYDITVTGASGTLAQSGSVRLTVQ